MARWPENVAAMRVAAAMAAESGEWDRANAILSAAIARAGPNDALLLMQAARAAMESGDVAAALPLARRAYRLLPGNGSASGIYGIVLSRAGERPQDAQDLLLKAVQLSPDDGLLREWLAEASQR
jgi:predicted Zn-dependent protease